MVRSESRARLVALVRGFRISQAIYVVTRLGIPDCSPTDLARSTNWRTRPGLILPASAESCCSSPLAADPQAALPVLHSDLEMLVTVGGRERTTDEHATLLARSGLRLARTLSLGCVDEAMGYHLIDAELA